MTRGWKQVVAVLAFVPTAALAGQGQWTTQGPWGGAVYGIAVSPSDPNVIIASAYSGMFRTTDGGTSWNPVNRGLEGPFAGSIVISPSQPGFMAVASVPGVLISADGGDHWQVSASNSGVKMVAIDPQNPSILFYADIFSGPVWRSLDAGGSWSRSSTGIQLLWTDVLFQIDPLQPTTLYAYSSAQLYKSTNRGDLWSPLPAAPDGTFQALAIKPGSSSTLYASTGFGINDPAGIWKSTDGGASWSLIPASPIAAELEVNPLRPEELYARSYGELLRSSDGGETWTVLDTPGSFVTGAFAVAAGDPPTLFVGDGLRIRKSLDGGTTWTTADTGFAGLRPRQIEVIPGSPSNVYAATSGEIFHRSPMGWDRIPIVNGSGAVLSDFVEKLVVDPSEPNKLYASFELQVFRSLDSGLTWTPSNTGLPSVGVGYLLGLHPSTPQVLFYLQEYKDVLYRSTDGGLTWNPSSTGISSIDAASAKITFDANDPGRIWLSDSSDKLYRSSDGGTSWEPLVTPFSLSTIMAPTSSPTVLFAASVDAGVWKSTDGGTTWSSVGPEVGLPVSAPTVLAYNPTDPEVCYALVHPEGVFRSTDSGATWHFVKQGPALDPMSPDPYLFSPMTLAVLPGTTDTLLVSASGLWELTLPLFADGFERGDTSAWSTTVP